MTNQILDFSESPARLRVQYQRLVVHREDQPDVALALADLAVVVAAHPQITYTQAVLSGLAEAGAVFVACDRQHLPVGMMLPLVGHHAQSERFAAQARASQPVRKRLWQQVVRAKICAQVRARRIIAGDSAIPDQVW
jgi:CRISPR-associated protein Cas1